MNEKSACQEMKKKLRREIKDKITEITPMLSDYSSRICDFIIGAHVYKSCKNLLAYMALPDEVNLQKLICRALEDGKNVFIPKVISTAAADEERMIFYQYMSEKDCCKGSFGISEPSSETPSFDFSNDNSGTSLIIVPGRAFAADGSRLGRGKAFYDSFLSKARKLLGSKVVFCGAGFSVQFLDALPLEAHDIKMDLLVNENGFVAKN